MPGRIDLEIVSSVADIQKGEMLGMHERYMRGTRPQTFDPLSLASTTL